MLKIPDDPMSQNDRFIKALCADWLAAGTVTRETPRANAVRCIARQINPREAGNMPGSDK